MKNHTTIYITNLENGATVSNLTINNDIAFKVLNSILENLTELFESALLQITVDIENYVNDYAVYMSTDINGGANFTMKYDDTRIMKASALSEYIL